MGFRLRGLEVGLLQRLDCLCTGILEPVGVGFGDVLQKTWGSVWKKEEKNVITHQRNAITRGSTPRSSRKKGQWITRLGP